MSKTGALHGPKHGGAHEPIDEAQTYRLQTTHRIHDVCVKESTSEVPCLETHSFVSSMSLLPDTLPLDDGVGCEEMSTMAMEEDDCVANLPEAEEEEGDANALSQGGLDIVVSGSDGHLNWLKSKDFQLHKVLTEGDGMDFQGNTISILERPALNLDGKDSSSVLDSSLFTVIGSDSELPDNLQDLVFSSALPDATDESVRSSLKSQAVAVSDVQCFTVGSYPLVSTTGQYHSTGQSFAVDGSSDIANNLFHSDSLEDSHASAAISTPASCNSIGDPHNILLSVPSNCVNDNFEHFSAGSSDYPVSEFAVEKQAVACDESHQLFSSGTHSSLPSLHVSGVSVSTPSASLSNLGDTSELNLNSLPNFLGLDNGSSNPSISTLLDGQSINLLDSSSVSSVPPDQALIKTEYLQQPQGVSTDLTGSDISVTTISISNDDKNATKIMVNTNQGQPQMYVINTTNLSSSESTKSMLGQGQQMYVINTSDVNQNPLLSQMTEGAGNVKAEVVNDSGQILSASASNASAENNFAAAAVGEIPGFILVPVVDNAANVIQTVSVQGAEEDANLKKSQKKLLRCSEPGCMKTFKKASKLKVHEMLHTGERPYKCTLLGCEWAFTTPHKLKRHMDSHEGRKDFVCDHPGCGHKFTTVYNLNTHRKLHERPCTEPCPEAGCNMSFPTKRQLDLHLRNVHDYEDRTFKCPHPGCEKVFFSSSCMGSHMRVHQQSVEDLRCKFPGCGKIFARMCRLKQHERLHTGEKPFICDYEGCTWAFATASKLKRHQTRHTGLRQWVCEVCKKSFHRSEHLKGHLITHSGSRPFVCPVEGEFFSWIL
ncbi:zinc finger protein 143 isoform X2 [Aplysia californica]|uniref:Zinc finger protein 143 isoform X2 n=1 Tax=Aplysia californica TaxID=6500 RepID=A0ABM1VR94_APLCA|nr:zinc finger protein 143 isoform X2 [Aplysia californica]